ncbi:hypothetical protein DPEC_G00174650 [Dallia pectoralis]|uniref:Uncharacterized protein n=1 Tax=Dallia pectoralis TaxID=75939 RepID=A0ACC2GEJ3_DALPE|nr:hypothetical protein DPEC_G00174650 [Dallia pectoralis]
MDSTCQLVYKIRAISPVSHQKYLTSTTIKPSTALKKNQDTGAISQPATPSITIANATNCPIRLYYKTEPMEIKDLIDGDELKERAISQPATPSITIANATNCPIRLYYKTEPMEIKDLIDGDELKERAISQPATPSITIANATNCPIRLYYKTEPMEIKDLIDGDQLKEKYSKGDNAEEAGKFVVDDTSPGVSNNQFPDVPDPLDSMVQQMPMSAASNDRPRTREIPRTVHSLPMSSFCPLTFNRALGNKRLDFLPQERQVVTKKMCSASHDDRFDTSQWMAEQEISDGCHHWDVDTSGSVGWAVGVAYPSIGRRDQLGRAANSWCLEWSRDKLCYWHNNMEEFMKHECPGMVRVAVDMTNGSLSFYSLTESQNLLHSVVERFSEAVRPAFWLFGLKQPNALFFPP